MRRWRKSAVEFCIKPINNFNIKSLSVEAEIARKTHEIASLEQSFPQRPIDSTSNCLYKVPFAGHTRANSVRERTL